MEITKETKFPVFGHNEEKTIYRIFLSNVLCFYINKKEEKDYLNYHTCFAGVGDQLDTIVITKEQFIKNCEKELTNDGLLYLFESDYNLIKEISDTNERIAAFNNDILVSNIKSLEEENAELRKLLKRLL